MSTGCCRIIGRGCCVLSPRLLQVLMQVWLGVGRSGVGLEVLVVLVVVLVLMLLQVLLLQLLTRERL